MLGRYPRWQGFTDYAHRLRLCCSCHCRDILEQLLQNDTDIKSGEQHNLNYRQAPITLGNQYALKHAAVCVVKSSIPICNFYKRTFFQKRNAFPALAMRTKHMKNSDNFFPYAASTLCGLTVYLAIIMATGKNEAWDDGSYYWAGMPFMCFAAFVLGYLFPVKPWRWALGMAGGQVVGALLNGSSFSLLPFAVIFMVIISIPQFIAASFGSRRTSREAAE